MSAAEPLNPAPTDVQDAPNITRIHARSTELEVVKPARVVPGVFGVIGDRRPAIFTDSLPSLADVWQDGKNRQYTGQKGVLRRLGQAYAGLAIILTAGAYSFIWVVRHPTRLVVAAAIWALIKLSF